MAQRKASLEFDKNLSHSKTLCSVRRYRRCQSHRRNNQRGDYSCGSFIAVITLFEDPNHPASGCVTFYCFDCRITIGWTWVGKLCAPTAEIRPAVVRDRANILPVATGFALGIGSVAYCIVRLLVGRSGLAVAALSEFNSIFEPVAKSTRIHRLVERGLWYRRTLCSGSCSHFRCNESRHLLLGIGI